MKKSGINLIVNTKCVEIKEKYVVIEINDKKEELSCDFVVIAVGSKSNDYSDISQYCEENDVSYQVIGDAKQARKVINAIEEAAEIARAI